MQWALFEADLDPARRSEQRGLRRLYPSEVKLPQDAADQPLDSIVMVHQIRTISKARLRRQLGLLGDLALRQALRDALREHLDLD